MQNGNQALEQIEGIHIIDCDSHMTEPPDLWTSRVPKSMIDRVPALKTVDGMSSWYLDGQSWSGIGGNTISNKQKVLGTLTVQPYEDIDPGAWSVKERLELLDTQGVHAAVLYPNGIGFSSNTVFAVDDLEARTVILQAYNDFYVDCLEESGGRLLGHGLLPIWDMELCVAEMTRLLDKGLRGFLLTDKPEMIGLPELHEPYFEPMWDLFNESGAVASFHVGSGNRREDTEAARAEIRRARAGEKAPNGSAPTINSAWSMYGPQRLLAVGAVQLYMSNVRIITNLCMGNFFDRYPNLKIVSAESGIGWVPFLLESMEYQLDEMVSMEGELTFAERRPTEYFRDHVYVMFWFETNGVKKLIDDIGVNNVLVETDLPHPTCLFPNARQKLAEALIDAPENTRRRVLQDNAAELYKINLENTLA